MKQKFLYIAPQCDEFTVAPEGVIATSNPGLGGGGFGSPFSNNPDEIPW